MKKILSVSFFLIAYSVYIKIANADDLKEKQYVTVNMPDEIVRVQYVYTPNEDRVIELSRVGLNKLFSFSKLYKIYSVQDAIYQSGKMNNLSTVQVFDTDIIGPIMVSAENNENGDDPIAAFTGGWHGFNRDQSGSPTARHISLQVWVDGKIVKDTFKGYANDGNDSNLLIVFYVQIMPDDFVMQLHRF